MVDRQDASDSDDSGTSPDRQANVDFGNALLDRELDRRDVRKREQESTARAVVVTSGALMTIMLALAKDAGIYQSGTSWVARGFFLLTLAAAVAAAMCGALTQRPRTFQRLGAAAFDCFNKTTFLDQPAHSVVGTILSTKIAIAKNADLRHEEKANWLVASFASLVIALSGVLGMGLDLSIEHPDAQPSAAVPILASGSTNHAVATRHP
jgi:hypothetical protein